MRGKRKLLGNDVDRHGLIDTRIRYYEKNDDFLMIVLHRAITTALPALFLLPRCTSTITLEA